MTVAMSSKGCILTCLFCKSRKDLALQLQGSIMRIAICRRSDVLWDKP